jgi:hypothetical protein
MLNSVLLQLLLAGSVNSSAPLDLHDATSTTTWKCAPSLSDAELPLYRCSRKGNRKPDPNNGADEPNDNSGLKKHSPNDKKRVSDLSPAEPKPLFGCWLHSLSHSRREAPGPDHGDDPQDEVHDGDLPANQHKHDGYPSKDPYNGSTSNDRNNPYKPY